MKADLSDLRCVRVLRHRNIDHVKFQQTLNGFPIEGAEYLVHVLSDGCIDMINGTYYQKIDISTKPIVSTREVFATAMKELGDSAILRGDTSAVLTIRVRGNRFFLVWRLTIPSKRPYGLWIFYFDASTGERLDKR